MAAETEAGLWYGRVCSSYRVMFVCVCVCWMVCAFVGEVDLEDGFVGLAFEKWRGCGVDLWLLGCGYWVVFVGWEVVCV